MAQLRDVAMKNNIDLEIWLIDLLQRLQLEESYETLLVYEEDFLFHYLSKRLNVHKVLMSFNSYQFDWRFRIRAPILSCGPEDDKETNDRTLNKLQRSRRIVYLPEDVQHNSFIRYTQKDQYNIAMVNFEKSIVRYVVALLRIPALKKFVENRFHLIFCILCCTSIMTTMFNAYLNSIFTYPPSRVLQGHRQVWAKDWNFCIRGKITGQKR